MEFTTTPLGQIGANCYAVKSEGKLCLIDPGDEPNRVLDMVEKGSETLELILLTHGHYDHTGAVKALTEKYPDVPVYIHQGDAQCAGTRLCPLAGEVSNLNYLTDGMTLIVGTENIKIMETPGHSEGSVCILIADHLFTGDTLFAGSMGRVDFPGGSYETIMKSLKKLSELPENIHVHPGHEGSSTIGQEKKRNPYMLEAMR